jgi:predicted DNA-binding transcriptional regulator YafY
VSDTPARMLRLLSLLQTRRTWPGAELAARLGVTDRTLRRDVERLRALDYPVESGSGPAGGYRLVAGRAVPPLQLDDEEALAMAIALATATGVVGDGAVRALAKLQQVLPARLRPRLTALTGTTAAVAPRGAPPVDPGTLAVLAACCRDAEVVAFGYRDRDGTPSPRRVEPHHLVAHGGRWYLVAFDPARDGWRSFRVDRVADLRPTRRTFARRALPEPDPAAWLVRSFAAATYRHTARLAVRASARTVREGVWGSIPGLVEETGPDACTVHLTAESAVLVVQFVAAVVALGVPVAVDGQSDEVAERVRGLGLALTGER